MAYPIIKRLSSHMLYVLNLQKLWKGMLCCDCEGSKTRNQILWLSQICVNLRSRRLRGALDRVLPARRFYFAGSHADDPSLDAEVGRTSAEGSAALPWEKQTDIRAWLVVSVATVGLARVTVADV